MRGIVVCSSTKSSGSARTTIDESAKATAIETTSAISRARACVCGTGSDVMAAAYAERGGRPPLPGQASLLGS